MQELLTTSSRLCVITENSCCLVGRGWKITRHFPLTEVQTKNGRSTYVFDAFSRKETHRKKETQRFGKLLITRIIKWRRFTLSSRHGYRAQYLSLFSKIKVVRRKVIHDVIINRQNNLWKSLVMYKGRRCWYSLFRDFLLSRARANFRAAVERKGIRKKNCAGKSIRGVY